MARHAPPESRRAQILAAALPCFAAKGYHEATMDDLARAAGLSKGSLYWHFGSKAEVFLALFDELSGAIFAGWDALEAETLSVPERLRRQGELVVEQLGRQIEAAGAWLGFLAHAESRARLARTYADARARLAGSIRQGIERGELAAVDPEATAALLTSAVEGLLLLALVDPAFDARRAWRGAWETLWNGLAPH